MGDFFLVAMSVLQSLTTLFVFMLGLGLLAVVVIFIIDITQTKQAIRRNFPVVGRFRYMFEHMGEFFRQYFFALDREEMPFNRAQRSWAYRAAKGVDNTVAFGSTLSLTPSGTPIFVNCPYPMLDDQVQPPQPIRIGPNARKPYDAPSFFNVSAMSYGALSKPAVQALSRGSKMAGNWLNTGEGGLAEWHLEGGCDVVFQIGTAKYGVRDEKGELSDDKLREIGQIDQVKMIELKLSQGAKPGKGGILPGGKVTPEISKIRGIPQGHDSISPNRHPEIDSADDLLDMLTHIRDMSGLPVGFKAVIGAYGWLDEVFALIRERGVETAPDFITVDSGDGGTGAAPMSLIDNVGLPIKESLPIVVDKLNYYGLRDHVRVIASGKLINPADAALALCMGADFVNTARGFMFALGCIQALQCNKNTCPTGITTHNKRLQRGLVPADKAERVAKYSQTMRKEIATIAHSCGVPEPSRLQRFHCRIVHEDGRSIPLDEIYPEVKPAI
ncbi:MAG: FMN-binding glutamate synthase family protein [Gammaproteobacteria bacterium]|nr:FMN-binding glutamate synthase family protein [Gammaproteobacteria bacterium]